jgi:hypothetical protein
VLDQVVFPHLKAVNAVIKAAMFETETKCSESGINVLLDEFLYGTAIC